MGAGASLQTCSVRATPRGLVPATLASHVLPFKARKEWTVSLWLAPKAHSSQRMDPVVALPVTGYQF